MEANHNIIVKEFIDYFENPTALKLDYALIRHKNVYGKLVPSDNYQDKLSVWFEVRNDSFNWANTNVKSNNNSIGSKIYEFESELNVSGKICYIGNDHREVKQNADFHLTIKAYKYPNRDICMEHITISSLD